MNVELAAEIRGITPEAVESAQIASLVHAIDVTRISPENLHDVAIDLATILIRQYGTIRDLFCLRVLEHCHAMVTYSDVQMYVSERIVDISSKARLENLTLIQHTARLVSQYVVVEVFRQNLYDAIADFTAAYVSANPERWRALQEVEGVGNPLSGDFGPPTSASPMGLAWFAVALERGLITD